ncbi:hypothetical protein AMECASPLE_011985 [Ameca splendens]|uniref:Uncharacterized protein n=1 Tax=Ameca splendens TaxID=208324 RepID=A0ABV0ZLW1_9TELE
MCDYHRKDFPHYKHFRGQFYCRKFWAIKIVFLGFSFSILFCFFFTDENIITNEASSRGHISCFPPPPLVPPETPSLRDPSSPLCSGSKRFSCNPIILPPAAYLLFIKQHFKSTRGHIRISELLLGVYKQ